MELRTTTSNPIENANVESDVKTLSSLLYLSARSDHQLKYIIDQKLSVSIFLRLMGIILCGNVFSVLNVFQIIWGLVVRISLVFMIIYGILIGILKSFTNDGEALLYIVMGITICLQGITLCFALFDMIKKLSSPIPVIAVDLLSNGLPTAYTVLFTSFVLGIFPILSVEDFPLFVVQCATSCVLTATMFFIALDCSIAYSLLDLLIEQMKSESLTFEQYSRVRDDISSRRNASAWTNNTIIVVALLDIACVLLFVFFNSYFYTPTRLKAFLTVVGLFAKEIPFLFVVYWKVAQVNEKSAVLLKDLGSKKWVSAGNNDRVELYVNAQSDPIYWSLAGMRLKRRDIAWQLALWTFAFVVGLIKTAFSQRVHY